MTETSKAMADVIAERKRQVEQEGWTPEHDDTYSNGELAQAASCYAYDPRRKYNLAVPNMWPKSWSPLWWKPTTQRRDLVKAAALIIAEIERIDRMTGEAAE